MRKLALLVSTLACAGCVHANYDQPNTADVSRPFERSTDPVQSTLAVDVNDDGNASAHRNEPPKPDAGTPTVVDTAAPH